MVSLKKYVPCKCGAANSFDFSSDMNVEDITVSARCPSCGNSITISISSLLTGTPSPAPSQQATPENPVIVAATEMAESHVDSETKENVEQAVRDLFKY
ncbi:Uncharacterised protein [uncultured archaeon]|nr:Uncharacterised protein [uncultured archaeon]